MALRSFRKRSLENQAIKVFEGSLFFQPGDYASLSMTCRNVPKALRSEFGEGLGVLLTLGLVEKL